LSFYKLKAKNADRAGIQGTQVVVEIETNPEASYSWSEFLAIIERSSLSSIVKRQSISVFSNLAKAENRAHRNSSPDKDEPLAELGSLDTIIDIVGTVAGFQLLGINRIFSSPIPMGSGIISSRHGLLPASSPATLELVAMVEAPIVTPRIGNTGELVTPTGAALLTSLAEFASPKFHLQSIGYGLGGRNPKDFPNALALWIGVEQTEPELNSLVLLETNIDDMNSQIFGYVQERLFSEGALDVWFSSIQMKKGRPGVLLSVLLTKELEHQLTSVIFSETSTLGIRTREVKRFEAVRESKLIETLFGDIHVKVKYLKGKPVSVSPEYDDCSRIAKDLQIPLSEILQQVSSRAWDVILGNPLPQGTREANGTEY